MAVQLFAVPDPTGRQNNRPEHIGRLEQLQSPYQTYLDRLAPTTRRSAESRLRLIANILWPGVPAPQAPWHELDAGALMNLRARLSERYRFDVAANYLAAAKGALKAAWLLGMVSTEAWGTGRPRCRRRRVMRCRLGTGLTMASGLACSPPSRRTRRPLAFGTWPSSRCCGLGVPAG